MIFMQINMCAESEREIEIEIKIRPFILYICILFANSAPHFRGNEIDSVRFCGRIESNSLLLAEILIETVHANHPILARSALNFSN